MPAGEVATSLRLTLEPELPARQNVAGETLDIAGIFHFATQQRLRISPGSVIAIEPKCQFCVLAGLTPA
ncbi:hypothetical protein [Pseudacidovorax intermedius]|uniref:hypothetical protein n=1 Tax=Pseudacidovorax intermedius TaxID=433924 RepID=UPI0012DD7ECF|nr:hypothetical protein [Pseudacidovorax intermedius]